MDYYQYQLLLQQQQHQQQQPLQTLQQQAAKVGVPSLPSFGAAISQTPNQQSAASLLYNPSQIPQQSVVQSQVNFKDTQFLGQPSMQLQDFKIMGNLPQQQHQGFMGSDLNSQLQGFPGSSAAAGVSGGIDLSQQVFFQKAIQNQYINNIQQNRDDIIRNYINIISQNRNRNPSNDNRNRNPSNDNRNRNPSNENRNQPMTQVPQMNNILLQQTSSTAAAQNQFSAPQFASTFQAQQVFQQQQQVQQQQQLLAQQQQQLQKQQQPSTWMQGAVASLPELNKQFIGDVNFPTSAFQQQQQQQQQPARHSNHHLHHHLQQQQQQQFQMNMGINLNEMSALQQQQTMTDKVMNFAAQQQQQVHAAASAQKLSEDPLIDSFDKENIRLQQQITLLNGKLLQLNQSQSEILSLNNYSANKSLIDYLEQQIQLITSQKKQILEQIESLQTLKLAYTKFRQVCPEGSASQFMSLSKDTQLLFLTQQGAPQQVSPQSLPLTATSEVSALKIEHTPLQLHFSNEVHSTLQSSNSIQQQSQDDQKSVSSKNSNSSNQKKNPFKVIRSNENSEDIDIAYLNRKRETPVQSPSLSKVSAHHNDLAVESSQSQKEQPKEILPEINHQVIPSEVAAVALQKDQEQQEAENKDSSIEDEKEMAQQNHEHNKIDEEDEDDDYDDDHNHDHGDMDNTSLAQTMSIAQKLSQMNPAESKKFEKRREKLEENVLKILEKSEDACSKIKPIALELCSKIAAESDVLKNRPYEAISAAVIVHASRLVANPITVKKMAKITESKEKIINRVFMYLKKNVEGFNNKMPQPEVFIKNICDKMKLTDAISKTAFFLHSQSDSLGLVKGQHAATVAACIVKLAACLNNMEMTVKQICEASNVCQISLRQLYRTIYPHRFELIGDHKINDIDFKKILNSPQMNLD